MLQSHFSKIAVSATTIQSLFQPQESLYALPPVSSAANSAPSGAGPVDSTAATQGGSIEGVAIEEEDEEEEEEEGEEGEEGGEEDELDLEYSYDDEDEDDRVDDLHMDIPSWNLRTSLSRVMCRRINTRWEV